MILPLIAPLLGSVFGPSLFSALGLSGMAPWLASGLGSGLASLAVTRDPQQALMSGLMGGLSAGGLSSLMGGSSQAAMAAANPAAVGQAAGKVAMAPMGNPGVMNAAAGSLGKMGESISALPELGLNVDDKLLIQAPRQGMGGLMDWVQRHPMMAAGALAIPAMLPNDPEYTPPEEEDIPENFPTGPGPRSGYDRTQPVRGQSIPNEEWVRYGRNSNPDPGEWQFFPDNELRAPPSVDTGSSYEEEDDRGGNAAERLRNALRTFRGFKNGGLIEGPGGPTDDLVPAIGPGATPIRLSAGEYVMPARAVQNAGGPEAMDALRSRLLKAGKSS